MKIAKSQFSKANIVDLMTAVKILELTDSLVASSAKEYILKALEGKTK